MERRKENPMTDPRIARLLELAKETTALAADLGVNVSLAGCVWTYGGKQYAAPTICYHKEIPPGMSALDFVWTGLSDSISGKVTMDDVEITVFLDAAQLHLVGDLLPEVK